MTSSSIWTAGRFEVVGGWSGCTRPLVEVEVSAGGKKLSGSKVAMLRSAKLVIVLCSRTDARMSGARLLVRWWIASRETRHNYVVRKHCNAVANEDEKGRSPSSAIFSPSRISLVFLLFSSILSRSFAPSTSRFLFRRRRVIFYLL